MLTEIPVPKIKRRPINEKREQEALEAGLNPVLARIIAARPFLENESVTLSLSPKLKSLEDPKSLVDLDKAVLRLVKALENQEIIGIETDHDCDGQTSHAVIYTALTEFFGHPKEKIRSYIGHRLKEGYGLSESVALRILADVPKASLIITADNGSADELRIAMLKSKGIDVIVTDHHEIPSEGIPRSAYAVINPTREDCHYPDRYIAGCMVAWLLMAATRQKLMQVRNCVLPSMAECLDFVAVGTIADCVSIARSRNNRAVVAYGMKLIEQGIRPCWRVLLPSLSVPLSSEDLGFKIGPLLNSDGRLACAFGSVSFLLANDDEEASGWVEHLRSQNVERKSIQDNVTKLAMKQAIAQCQTGKMSLCLFLEEGHAGVHGISASRVKDMFGRPVIILCPKSDNAQMLTGSARSIDGFHLRHALEMVNQRSPGLLDRFGGHQGAAGLSLHRDNLPNFREAFEQATKELLNPEMIGPTLWTDGEISVDKLSYEFVNELVSILEPFGREFEPPLFEMEGKIISLTPMGQTQTHARLGVVVDEIWFEAVWFNGREPENPWPVAVADQVKMVFSPKLQTFRGQRKLSCQVVYLEKLAL